MEPDKLQTKPTIAACFLLSALIHYFALREVRIPIALPNAISKKISVKLVDRIDPLKPNLVTRAPKRVRSGQSHAKGGPQPSGHVPMHYANLLPSSGDLAHIGGGGAARNSGQSAAGVDPASIQVLSVFARDLSQWVDIPSALKRDTSSASARLTMTRTSRGWRITRVVGERYFRAILYDAISAHESDIDQAKLNRLNYSSFDVVLEFSSHETMDPRRVDDSLEIIVEAAKVSLQYHHPKVPPLLRVVHAERDEERSKSSIYEPSTSRSVDLIGLGAAVLGAFRKPPPELDSELKPLRSSPAFIHPIGN